MSLFTGTSGPDNLTGGAGADTIDLLGGNDTGRGLGGDDSILGGVGNDSLIGDDGADTLDGGNGTDTIFAGNGADSLVAGLGFFDFLEGQSGADTINGTGATSATAAWSTSPAGIVLNAGAGTAQDGFGFTDSILGVAFFSGSALGDSMVGGAGLAFGATFTGRGGNDTIVGAGFEVSSSGLVRADYSDKAAGGVIDLAAGTATYGAEVDTLVDIQRVIGSAFADIILGSDGDDVIRPLAGDDSIDGREGSDLIDYSFLTASGVTVTGGAAIAPPGSNASPAPQANGGGNIVVAVIDEGIDFNQSLSHFEGINLPDRASQVDLSEFPTSLLIVAHDGAVTGGTGFGNDQFFSFPSSVPNPVHDFGLGAGDDVFGFFGQSLPPGAYDGGLDFDIFSAKWSDGVPVTVEDIGFALRMVADGNPDVEAIIEQIEQLDLNDANWRFNLGNLLQDFNVVARGGAVTGALGAGDNFLVLNPASTPGVFDDIDLGGGFNTLDVSNLVGGGSVEVEELLNRIALLPGADPAARAGIYAEVDDIFFGSEPYSLSLALYGGGVTLHGGGGDLSGTLTGFDDRLVANLGTYSIDGGVGTNTADYTNVGHPILGDIRVRQAIAHAVDVQDLINHTLTNFNNYVGSPFPDTFLNPVPYDPAAAAKLLEEAGWVSDTPVVDGAAGDDDFEGRLLANYANQATPIVLATTGQPNVYTLVDGFGNTDTLTNVFGVNLPPVPGNIVDFGDQIGAVVGVTGGSGSIGLGPQGVLDLSGVDGQVTIDLGQGSLSLPGGGYTLNGVNNVIAASGGGTITGNGAANIIVGGELGTEIDAGDGDDTVVAGGGDDRADGGGGVNTLAIPPDFIPRRTLVTANGAFLDVEAIELLGEINQRGLIESREFQAYVVGVNQQILGFDELLRTLPPTSNQLEVAGVGFFLVTELSRADIQGNDGSNEIILFGGSFKVDARGGNDVIRQENTSDFIDEFVVIAAPPPPGVAVDPPPLVAPAGPNDDNFSGGAGNDTILSGLGEDVVEGGADNDVLIGERGNDSIAGGPDADLIFGGPGDDFLVGEDGDDVIYGGAGADAISGGGGNDRIAVLPGHDLAIGGLGDGDVLVLGPSSTGINHIHLLDLTNQNASGVGPVLRTFEGVDASGAPAAVDVSGADLGGILAGSAFADTLAGGAGDEAIVGNGGADLLDGGGGDDAIFADAGDDTVTGGAGADDIVYFGGAGAGAVRITDFASVDDTIVLPSSLAATAEAARALAQQVGADAVLAFGAGRSITLAGVQVGALTVADFEIV